MLINVYETLLLDFEEQSRHSQAAQAAQVAKMQQQQQGQIPLTLPGADTTSRLESGVQTDEQNTSNMNQPNPSDKAIEVGGLPATDIAPAQPTDSTVSVAKIEEPIPLPSQSPANAQAGPSSRSSSRAGSTFSQIGPGSLLGANRPEGEMLAHRQRMLLQAQTKAMLQGVPSPTLSVRSGQESGTSGTKPNDSGFQGDGIGNDGITMNGSDGSLGNDVSLGK